MSVSELCEENVSFANNKTCNKCNDDFTTQGLKRHTLNCHVTRKEFKCPECGEMLDSKNRLNKHKEDEHTMEQVKRREVCKHWRRGNCTKGISCMFSHVGHVISPSTSRNTNNVPKCRNGLSCEWLAKQRCSFFHHSVGI